MMIRRNMRKVLAVLLAASISMSNAYVPVYAQETVMLAEESENESVAEEVTTSPEVIIENNDETIKTAIKESNSENVFIYETNTFRVRLQLKQERLSLR